MTRGRKKSGEWGWLPKYCGPKRGHIVYRKYEAGQWFAPVFVCTMEEARRSRALFHERFAAVLGRTTDYTLDWLLSQYHKSPQYRDLALATRKLYEGYQKAIGGFPLSNGHTFGEMPLRKLTQRHMRQYLDNYPGKFAANRHIQYLSAVFNWGRQRLAPVTSNPCEGVTKNKESPRDRYIEDWEYAIGYQAAASMRTPIFAPAMELSYLGRARRGEVFRYTELDIRRQGLYLKRGKGSRSKITVMSDRLQAAIEYCRQIHPQAPDRGYLLHKQDGTPYGKNALDSAWQRVMDKAMGRGWPLPPELAREALEDGAAEEDGKYYLIKPYPFHDIKAKGVTDHINKEGGHRSAKMRAVYDRKPRVIPATR